MPINKKFILTTTASLLVASSTPVDAFTTFSTNGQSQLVRPASTTSLSALNNENNGVDEELLSERRTFLRNAAGLAFGGLGMLMNEQPASATYSAYTNREKDWQERKESGDIQYSNARDLRRQLAEVAPMNTAKSKVFCPNGPSAAVSPLMENKCNDQLAMPSVFGRADDVMGNSIPGKNPVINSVAGTTALSADIGGFPSYSSSKK
mmetsp:Transcript_9948/g.12534  ORF Transcript_9948/g.12534 Transcript_9948/m.12534 type:complete len:207 (-) Transcript_9948:194-814(-)